MFIYPREDHSGNHLPRISLHSTSPKDLLERGGGGGEGV